MSGLTTRVYVSVYGNYESIFVFLITSIPITCVCVLEGIAHTCNPKFNLKNILLIRIRLLGLISPETIKNLALVLSMVSSENPAPSVASTSHESIN